ncbi:MAG TPA: ABC transporter substrate-binding protein [Deinococcales bacterium]|nr:ABC transporter substrate-binding protein [Deinococcales bacterium]
MLKRLLATLVLAALPSAVAATYPLTVKDDLGRNVTLRAEPKRIVSLVPSHTETVYAVAAGSRLVGRDDYSNYPADALKVPAVGGLYNPNLEAILAAKPDLVLASEYSGDLVKALEKANVTVWAGGAQSFQDIFKTISDIGLLLGQEAEAARLNSSIRRDVRTVEIITAKLPKTPVYYEIDPTPYSVGPNSYLGVLLDKAGGKTIVPAALGDFPKISPELVVSANPSVIIGTSRDEVAKRAGWSAVTAVKRNRVYTLTREQDDIVSRAGPRVGQALRILARLLHPGLFR